MDRRARVLAHVAPTALGFLYAVWVLSGADEHNVHSRWSRAQVVLAILAFLGGLGACWLPARPLYRVLLVLASFFVAGLLLTVVRTVAA